METTTININKDNDYIPTVYELLNKFRKRVPASKMFSKEQMFNQGESLKTMIIMKRTQEFRGHTCYVLRSLRKQPRTNLRYYAYYYFDKETYEYVGYDCKHTSLLSPIQQKDLKNNFFEKIPTNFRKVCPEEKKHPIIYSSLKLTRLQKALHINGFQDLVISFFPFFFLIPFVFYLFPISKQKPSRGKKGGMPKQRLKPCIQRVGASISPGKIGATF